MEPNKNFVNNKLYLPSTSTSASAQALQGVTEKDTPSQFMANLLAEALGGKSEQTIIEAEKTIIQCQLSEPYDEAANRYHVEQMVDQIMCAYMYTREREQTTEISESTSSSSSSSSNDINENTFWGYNSKFQVRSVINLYDEQPSVSSAVDEHHHQLTILEISSPESSIRSIGSIVCRICHNAENPERLVSPCLCKGSLTYVHEQCLKRWIATSRSTKCELCQYQYNTEQTLRYTCFQSLRMWYSRALSRRALQEDCQMLSLLTLVAFGIIGTLLVGMQYYFASENALFGVGQLWTKAWLFICLFITLSVYLVNVYMILKQQLMPWFRWWQSARDIVLVLENHNRFTLHAERRTHNRPLLADIPQCSDITDINVENNSMHNNRTTNQQQQQQQQQRRQQQQILRNVQMAENASMSLASLYQHMSLIETQREVSIIMESINSTQSKKLNEMDIMLDSLDFPTIYFDPIELI